MTYLKQLPRGLAALFLLAALLSCGVGSTADVKLTASAVNRRVADDQSTLLKWDAPGAGGVLINGVGRTVTEGGVEKIVPYEPAGELLVKPAETAPSPMAAAAGPDEARAPSASPAERGPVFDVLYKFTAVKGGQTLAEHEIPVTVHRRVPPPEAEAMQKAGAAVILDVRDARFFAPSDNIPGSINIPREDLDRRADELPADKAVIVTYLATAPEGAGPAWGAVWTLADRGRKATVLLGGTEAWWHQVPKKK